MTEPIMVTRTPAAPLPRQREILWQTLRILRRATTQHLVAVTDRPKNAVQRELRYLERTGYVRTNAKGARYDKCTWWLVRDTGPKPPRFVIGDDGDLARAVDRNTGALFNVGPQGGRLT
jgi:hypothetical protein